MMTIHRSKVGKGSGKSDEAEEVNRWCNKWANLAKSDWESV